MFGVSNLAITACIAGSLTGTTVVVGAVPKCPRLPVKQPVSTTEASRTGTSNRAERISDRAYVARGRERWRRPYRRRVIRVDSATVLLQWAVGGLFFLWFTTRRRMVGIGYGWLLRGTYLLLAVGAFACGVAFGVEPAREAASIGVAVAALFALGVSV